MSAAKNGGPAFPIQNAQYTEAYGGAPGMTLRDWFAGNVAANQMQLNGHNVNEHQRRRPPSGRTWLPTP